MRALLLALLFPAAHAAIVVQYDIPTSGNTSAATTSAATVTGADITGAGGFAVSTSSGTAYCLYSNMTSTLAGAIAGTDFLQFSITIPSGTTVSLSDLNIGFRSELTTVTSNLSLFATIGTFTAAPNEADVIGTVSTASNTTGYNDTISISSPSLQNLTNTTVTFRLYGYDVDSTSGSNYLRVDNFTLNGTVVIPEPSALILGLAALPFLVRRKR